MSDKKISQFEDGGSITTTDEIATNRNGVNTKVFVGSAAAKDAGTSVGDLLEIESVGGNPGLPAIDGSQLLNVGSGAVKVDDDDSEGGYLSDKLIQGNQIVINTFTDVDGYKTLNFSIRNQFATPVSIGTGTHTVNFDDGDFHTITATGVFNLNWSMENGEAVMIRAIDFDSFAPVDNLDWGDTGVPDWQGNDDFIVYRDGNGDYIGVLVALGIS
jgi:hypothetical protein